MPTRLRAHKWGQSVVVVVVAVVVTMMTDDDAELLQVGTPTRIAYLLVVGAYTYGDTVCVCVQATQCTRSPASIHS